MKTYDKKTLSDENVSDKNILVDSIDYSIMSGYVRDNLSKTTQIKKNSMDDKLVDSNFLDSNLPFNTYRKEALIYFKNKIRSKGHTFKINKSDREIYSPEIVEVLKEKLIPGNAYFTQKKLGEISDVFSSVGLVSSRNDLSSIQETEKILDLITTQKYKLIGYPVSIGIFKPINIIFERHGSNYDIYDTGRVSSNKLSKYLNKN